MAERGCPKTSPRHGKAMFAIAGTPRPIVAKLHAAVIEAIKDEKTRRLMTDAGMIPSASETPEAFKTFLLQAKPPNGKRWYKASAPSWNNKNPL